MSKRIQFILDMTHRRRGIAVICALFLVVVMSGTVLAFDDTTQTQAPMASDIAATEAITQAPEVTTVPEETTAPEEIAASEETTAPEETAAEETETPWRVSMPETIPENPIDLEYYFYGATYKLSQASAYMFFGPLGEWQKNNTETVVIDGREVRICDLDNLTEDNKVLMNGRWVDMDEYIDSDWSNTPVHQGVVELYLENYSQYGLYYDEELNEFCYDGKIVFSFCFIGSNDQIWDICTCSGHLNHIKDGIILKVENDIPSAVEDGEEFAELYKRCITEDMSNNTGLISNPPFMYQWIIKQLDLRAANG